jgi:predicted CxxxxCH...CXXCH cytochrome family protein
VRSIRLAVLALAAAALATGCDSARPLVENSGTYPAWEGNCTLCHGTRTEGFVYGTSPINLAAPPFGTRGETEPTQAAVGAHQKHLGNGSTFTDGIACTECHALPTGPNYLAHLNGPGATLTFGALATQGGLAPSYAGGSCAATYCHGAGLVGGANTAPVWASPGSVKCGDCHGLPPNSGRHVLTPNHLSRECSACHVLVATSTLTPGIIDNPQAKGLHVDGNKAVNFIVDGTWDPATKSCSNVACHTRPPSTRYWEP